MTKTKTRLLTVGLAFIVLLAAALFVIPNVGRNASAEPWSGNVASDFAGGTGSQDDPYQISNGEELALLADKVNKGEPQNSKYFQLTVDIDLGGIEWTPIGSNDVPFGGTFDGNGKTIYNLKSTTENAGLFGFNGDSGTIKNVYLDDVDVVFDSGMGAALCAVNNYGGTIESCAVLGGTVYGSNLEDPNGAAGICSKNDGTISKCYNLADVTVNQNGAGIAAFNNGTVSNCYNAGTIKGEMWVGGICYNNCNSKIEYCLNFGKINGKSSAGISAFMENTTITKSYTDVNCSKIVYYSTYGTNNSIDGEPLTTAELCRTLPSGFGSEWAAGVADVSSINSKLKAVSYTYPSLNGVTQTAFTGTADIYNFGTDNDTDWQPVTVIYDAGGLKAINDDLSGNYVLGDDIGLADVEWTPIGSEGSPFTGLFSGDGKTISNLKLEVSGRTPNVGLFGYNSGTIKDVYLADIDISTRGTNAAGLCAINNAGATIDGCAVLSGNVVADNSTLAATGVAGICSNNSGTINRCYNMASVKTNVSGAGVVNANCDGGIVSNCYNAGEVSSIGNGSGTTVGGISSTNNGTIKYCFNYGNVNNGDIVGGICGQNDDNKGAISSCYSDSTVCKAGAVGNSSNKLTDVDTMTTEVLCDKDFFFNNTSFDDKVWVGGTYDIGARHSDPAIRFGEFTITYPSLNGVGEKYMIRGEAYNFKTDGADDWQRYTLITTAKELAAINDNLDGNYVLGDDINLGGADWTPIGSVMGGAFTGKFSGDGHTISGVNVSVANPDEYAGLFGCSTGVIMNVAVEGDISGTSCVGGICGGNSAADGNGIIYACSFKGTVTGKGTNIGGIVGYNFKGSATVGAKISNCFSAAKVKGGNEVGGICGYNEDGATVSNTISVGTVSGSGNLVAAVCGKNEGTLTNNYFDTDVCSLVGAKDNTGAEYTDGTTGKTTAKLCDETIMQDALDTTNMWNLGIISFTYDRSNARKRVTTYTYPSLKGIAGSVYSTEVKEYNFSTGNSTNWQPYTEIGTPEKFIALGNDDSKWSGNYVLTKDIDLDGETVTPIGDGVTGTFRGNFSGDGHTISGVKISSNGDNVGLFGFAGYSSSNLTTIMNLAVEGDIEGKSFVGGICGYGNEKVEIFACSFKGSVSGGSCVGGICGGINMSCYIENCFNSGTVSGESNVGGLLGYSSYIGNVNYSINVGEVSGTTSTNPICGAVSNILNAEYNYYNSDIFSGTDSNGTAKTTAELCDKDALTALNLKDFIWQAGEITRTTDAENKRMSVVNAKYLSLNGVGEPLSLDEVKQYNFKTNGDDDDWQTYTEITSAADLNKINDNLGGNYVLMKDIKLTGNFTPIGSQTAPFTGKFSGNGHKITVSINTTAEYASIFGYNNGTIMNLAVEGNIVGTNNVGSICGYNNGMIYACSFNGSVKGESYVGGISGYNSGTISNCYAIGSVEATVDYAGGISSKNENGKRIEYCYFAGTAVAPDYNAICSGASPNCYYDRELYNINSNGGDALTTAELCSSNSLPDKFSDEIWETGEFSVKSTDGKFRTVSFTYPRLKEGCAAYAVNDVKQYNFGMDGNDNWAQFNEINSLGDLNNINKNHHTNYVLMTNIDLDEGEFSPLVPDKSFWGYFSGNGNTIKGDIDGNKPHNGDFTALFSSNRGLIMNLAVKGNVSGADLVGGICGRNYGTIYGCSFEGSVKGKKWVGGICGEMRGGEGERISNCYVIGTIEATGTLAGGISGDSWGAQKQYAAFFPTRIENCYFVGTVTVPKNAQKDAITVKTTADTYVLTVENCYYNKDIYTGSTTYGTAKTSEEFYSGSLLTGFDDSVWEAGKTEETYDPDNARMRSQERIYPSLIGVGEPYSVAVKQYNFGIDSSEDWQEYTEISEFEDFEKINDNLGGNYVLMKDIDLKNKPIDTSLVGYLSGKFSGDGHTISGVNISSDSDSNYTGLFWANNGTIMYLAVKGNVTGGNAGGICGVNGAYADSGTFKGIIYSCSFEGTVTGKRYAGGICGTNQENGRISNCYAIADVVGANDYTYVGGIAGETDVRNSSSSDDTLISFCLFAGTITSDAKCGGAIYGISGLDTPNDSVSECYYNSDLCDMNPDDSAIGYTTKDFCESAAPNIYFKAGYYNATVDSNNDRMRTLSYRYPSLVIGCAAYERKDIKQYNFKTDGADDWQEYTEINSAADLAKINADPNGNYVLMNDIPLGKGFTIPKFNGKFSGNGHIISGVKISAAGDNAGLFGENNGLIMYLAVKGNVSGGTNVGGICATNSGTIYGCLFDGSVTGSENVGGICGNNLAGGVITNCFTTGTVTCTTDNRTVGGVCGIIDKSVDSDGKISNCISICKIVGYGSAICGNSGGAIVDCYYNTEISSSTDSYGGTGMTTDELCVVDMGSEWEKGSFKTVAGENAKFRTATAVYPKLKCFKDGYTKTMKQYDFGYYVGDNWKGDWQEYTKITSADEFIALGNDKSKWNNNYVLTADIDLKGKTVKPIGSSVDEFTGKFSGDGHTISNVTITGESYVGLFGCSTSKIMNLAVVNGNISGTEGNVGGICGYLEHGSIINCSFEGSVKGGRNVGGICGYDWAGTISNCYAIADIEADGADEYFKNNNEEYAGGICGLIKGFSSYNGQVINNCYFVGTVKGDGNGAILGMENSGGNAGIENCCYNSDLCTKTGNGTGLSTLDMTSSNALIKMGLNGSTWESENNIMVDSKGENGVAYYPSLKVSNHVSSEKFTANLTFERTDDKKLTYLDEFEIKYGGEIEFANGVTVALDNTNCDLSASDDVDDANLYIIDFDTVTTDTFKTTVMGAGKITYTFTCPPRTNSNVSELLPSKGITKSFTVNAAKYTLTADDFEVDIPSLAICEYNGKPWTVTVKIKENTPLAKYKGYGDITVRYYDYDHTDKEVEPINAGDYLVKLDVSEGENCYAATGITADNKEWYLGITKADFNPAVVNVTYNWETTGEHSVDVVMPTDLGRIARIYGANITGDRSIISAARYEDGKVYFTFSANTDQDSGKMAIIECRIDSQNYEPIFAMVYVTLNGLANQEPPSADDFDLVLNNSGSNITAEIKTDLTGVEFSFDGVMWSTRFSTPAQHDELIVGFIRYAATSTQNASAPSFKMVRSGHGDLSAHHHDRVEPTCTDKGSIEYWECIDCDKKFSDAEGLNEVKTVVLDALGHDPSAAVEENRVEATCTVDGSYDLVVYCSVCNTELSRDTKTIPAKGHDPEAAVEENRVEATCTVDGSYDEVVYCSVCDIELSRDTKTIPAKGHTWASEYECDKTGHWHKCEACDAVSSVESHVSSGPATYAQAEICKLCGFEIAPRKSGGGGGGGGNGGGGGGSTPRDTKPSIDGKEMNWGDIAAALSKLAKGSEVTIQLNGSYDVPVEVIKAIADGDLKATFVVDSYRSWFIDGVEIITPAAADLRIMTIASIDSSSLRGTAGYKFSLDGTNNPTALTIAFNTAYAGQFANLYKISDGKPVFVDNIKVDKDGNAVLPNVTEKGDYVLMLCEFSDRKGDANNDGKTDIADALAILRDAVKLEDAANPVMRDYNGDGKYDISDARDLLKDVVFGKI